MEEISGPVEEISGPVEEISGPVEEISQPSTGLAVEEISVACPPKGGGVFDVYSTLKLGQFL